jgi:hypothetical protein
VTCVDLSNGYSLECHEIEMLFELVFEMDVCLQGLFLKFVRGSSRLSIGGVANLRGRMTIARKSHFPIDELPSATVCYNSFKMPRYGDEEYLRGKLLFAIEEGQERFTMS